MARTFGQTSHAQSQTRASAVFPLSDLTGTAALVDVRLESEQASHEVFTLTYVNAPLFLSETLRTGAPVVLTISNALGSHPVPGYVHHTVYQAPTAQNGKATAAVVCVGASYPLKERANNVWSGLSVKQIVLDIATRFNLGADIDECDYVYESYPQTGRSYWQVLRDLADKFGFILRVDGATLRFLTPGSAMRTWTSEAPTLRMVPNQQGSASSDGTLLFDFKMTSGQLTTYDHSWQTEKVVTGVDGSGNIYTASSTRPDPVRITDDSSPFVEYVSVASGSYSEAAALAEGAARRDRYPYNARVTSAGNQYVTGDRVVSIAGVGGDGDGLWTVRRAVHHIDAKGVYTMDLDIGTDGLGVALDNGRVMTAVQRPIRDLSGEAKGVTITTEDDWYLYQPTLQVISGRTGTTFTGARWRHRNK